MSDNTLHNMRMTRNIVAMLAVLAPIFVYTLTLMWLSPQIGLQLGVVIFAILLLIAGALTDTIRSIDRRL